MPEAAHFYDLLPVIAPPADVKAEFGSQPNVFQPILNTSNSFLHFFPISTKTAIYPVEAAHNPVHPRNPSNLWSSPRIVGQIWDQNSQRWHTHTLEFQLWLAGFGKNAAQSAFVHPLAIIGRPRPAGRINFISFWPMPDRLPGVPSPFGPPQMGDHGRRKWPKMGTAIGGCREEESLEAAGSLRDWHYEIITLKTNPMPMLLQFG